MYLVIAKQACAGSIWACHLFYAFKSPSEDLKELGHSFNLVKYKTPTRAQTKQKALLLPKEQGNDQLCSQSLINAKISPAPIFQNSLATFQIK